MMRVNDGKKETPNSLTVPVIGENDENFSIG